jgi:hypothetical protein
MLVYNLNCWLMLFNRDEEATAKTLGHTTLATARLKVRFLATRIWSHVGRVGGSYSESYGERPVFERLMIRLRAVVATQDAFAPDSGLALLSCAH